MKIRLKYMMMILPGLVLLLSSKEEPNQKFSFSDGKYNVEYGMLDGRYHGPYNSWYLSGKKRAEGTFQNNIRVGVWSVYDSTGRLRMKRQYKNNFEYETLFPEPVKEGPAVLFSQPIYRLEYGAEGFIKYFYLEERAVAVSKRLWRYMPNNSSQLFFANTKFYSTVIDSIAKGKVKVYANGYPYQEFEKPLSEDRIKLLMDTSHYELLGFRLIEDWFFDKDRMISETRTLGLCPVVRFDSQKDSTDLGWIYLPTIRPILAAHKVSAPEPSYIHTLDDVIFFRCFQSSVYRESRVYDRFKVDLSWEYQQRIETNLIEMEHDQWIFFTK